MTKVGSRNFILTGESEIKTDRKKTTHNLPIELEQIFGRSRYKRDIEKTTFIKSYKRQKSFKSNYRQNSGGTRHINEKICNWFN